MSSRVFATFAFFSILFIVFLSCSNNPASPYDISNTKIDIYARSVAQTISDNGIEDSVGNVIEVGFTANLPMHLDSVQFIYTIRYAASARDSLFGVFRNISSISNNDTLWNSITFADTGTKIIKGIAYISNGKTYYDSIIATIRPKPINHKPDLNVTGMRNILTSQICSLTVTVIDIDSLQTHSFSALKKPADGTFANQLFTWKPLSGFIGTDTAIFQVTDNGYPQMSDIDTVFITVSDTTQKINHPPEWQKDTLVLIESVGNALNLTLASLCSDADSDIVTFKLLYGTPTGDTIKNSIYSFIPSVNDTGIFYPQITASDQAGLKDTLTLHITINAGDTTPPKLGLVQPVKDSVITNASNYTVKLSCKDSSGTASVIGVIGTVSDTGTNESDSLWSITISGLTKDTFNTIIFTATDKSIRRNKDTLTLHIKYDPTIADAEGPVIKQIGGSKSGDTVSSASVTIIDSITDPSGVDSVYATLNGRTIKKVLTGSSNLYTLVDTLVEGLNTISITAKDKSANQNKTQQTILVNYIIAPTIITQPVSQTACVGTSATLSVIANGTKPLNYKWYKGTIASGKDTNVFTINSTSASDTGNYTVVVSNGSGSVTSDIANISLTTVSSKPIITPALPSTCPGIPITLHLSGATLGIGASWKWYTGSCGDTLVGSDSTLTITPAGNTIYYVRAEGGCVTTDCAFTKVTVDTVPAITSQSVSQTRWVEDSVTFSVNATGSSLTYQWYHGTSAISGATNPSYKIDSILQNDSGSYTCKVTNNCGTVTSNTASLTVSAVAAVAAGEYHSLILKTDGTLWTCGLNSTGQLGDNSKTTRKTPVKITTNVKNISAGGSHSLIIKDNGSLWACGNNGSGQLGDGTSIEKDTLVQITTSTEFQNISAGHSHSLFIKTNGTLWACGENGDGQLGDSTISSTNTITQITNVIDIKNISADYYYSLILKTNGALWVCGRNWQGQCGTTANNIYNPTSITDSVINFSAANSHSLIIKTNGTLWATGTNGYGQLGTTTNDTSKFIYVTDGVENISAGYIHSLILKTTGILFGCGDNESGQLGNTSVTNNTSTPVEIMSNVQSMSAGSYFSLIVKNDGSLWACGDNTYGQLGDGTMVQQTTPVRIRF